MSITPAELREVRFPIVKRGYDTEAVDRAMGNVADAIDRLLAERSALQAQLRERVGQRDPAMLELLGEARAIRSLLHTMFLEHPDG